MRGHGAKFSRKMEAAVTALLTQKNLETSFNAPRGRSVPASAMR